MPLSFDIANLKQVDQYIRKKKRSQVEEKISNSMKKIGLYVEGEVKQSIAGHRAEPTSVDTGKFLNSVKSISDATSARIYTPLDYPIYLEKGTSRIKARPHFGNTAKRVRKQVIEVVNIEVNS